MTVCVEQAANLHQKGRIIMKSPEIYFSDLLPEIQAEVLALYGGKDPEEANEDTVPFPLFQLEVYDDDE